MHSTTLRLILSLFTGTAPPSLVPGNVTDPLMATMTYQKMALAAAMCLAVGIIQLIMGVARLGFLTRYLSDPMISGFTTGASVHVFTSQVKYALGIDIPRHSGAFTIPKVGGWLPRKAVEQHELRERKGGLEYWNELCSSSASVEKIVCDFYVFVDLDKKEFKICEFAIGLHQGWYLRVVLSRNLN